MDTVDVLFFFKQMSKKTNNACFYLDCYYIINGLPIDKKALKCNNNDR